VFVRGDVCRHADGDAGAAINEKIWKRSRENGRFGAGFVVVRDEIDRVLFHVGHERGTEMGHARLGVTHRRWGIALDRSEISLAVNQGLAHGPRLRHVDERWVDHRFAVGMVITAGIAADLGALPMLPSGEERQIVHRIENSPLRWLEPVARIW